MKDRVWIEDSLHGALDVTENELTRGYDNHLDSWDDFTRTEVEMANGTVTYTVRSLKTWEVLATYN